ncbi:MAG TPA: sugar phosphate isomerase/epimerase family protein [Oscillospiraceae bacterium]|nr:sugar phosphate isomerase/epimerase family protein [Oscillospiraceae bacterium]
MKIGVCVSAKESGRIKAAKEAGFDYIEISVSGLSDMTKSEVENFRDTLISNNIPCEAANCFIKPDNKLVGKTVDYKAIIEYLDRVLPPAEDIGIKTIVFGSGGARNREDDFPADKAYRQVVLFLKEYAAPKCKNHGIEIAIEPLMREASKMIHTVKDAVQLAKDSGKDNVKALADILHMYKNDDALDNILKYDKGIIHSHISNPKERYFPLSADEYDYKSFINNLKAVGCKRCSIEAHTDNFELDITPAFKTLDSLR